MPNVVKGGDMGGLVRYLVGAGRANEHESPHVVSGTSFVVAWHGSEVLDRESADQISAYLDEPRRVYGVEMKAQVKELDPATGRMSVAGWKKQDVWHCSLSVAAEEGPLGDEQWDAIARDFMDEMGFTEAGGKAPARWVAIHHGASTSGNDHIHIAASMVREDGTKWEGRHRDFVTAQKVARTLERKYGLVEVTGRAFGTSELGVKPAERAAAERVGSALTAPQDLALRVRAAAVASTSEAEWIRRVRESGAVIKPFFAQGTTDVVAGYSVACKPGEYTPKWVFYGGGRLGKDLSLPRLREAWEAPTVEQAAAAAAEWQAAFRGQGVVDRGGRETRGLKPGIVAAATSNLGEMHDALARVPAGDQAAWANAAQEVSGALSAWAKADPDARDELNAAARAVARSAQMHRKGHTPKPRAEASAMGTALLFAQLKNNGKGAVAVSALMHQVLATAAAIRDHHTATGNLREARAVHTNVVERLERVQLLGYADETHASHPAMVARRLSQAGQAPARQVAAGPSPAAAGDVLPPTLTPGRVTTHTRDGGSDARRR